LLLLLPPPPPPPMMMSQFNLYLFTCKPNSKKTNYRVSTSKDKDRKPT
jgi:hypothetical protein